MPIAELFARLTLAAYTAGMTQCWILAAFGVGS